MRRAIVIALERLCGLLDRIPVYSAGEWRMACWGCYPLHLSRTSAELDERWGTDVWKPVGTP